MAGRIELGRMCGLKYFVAQGNVNREGCTGMQVHLHTDLHIEVLLHGAHLVPEPDLQLQDKAAFLVLRCSVRASLNCGVSQQPQ